MMHSCKMYVLMWTGGVCWYGQGIAGTWIQIDAHALKLYIFNGEF